jgi:hypothetical protein
MTKIELNLLNCPFCGEKAELYRGTSDGLGAFDYYEAGCYNHNCSVMPQITADTEIIAQRRWNKRNGKDATVE